ncbi:trypsin-like serine protease [Pseudoduganella sp. FT55W]|uniref:Trypsin-like serine protease n=1 Tax=Duganella rivi TaxID=2666083 RepID=A0A7X4GQA0_9BURK|nr:S1 family peptidase [Duganella rivi]MYM67663.1 trypsin-like serine protease [Duganella rivi]
MRFQSVALKLVAIATSLMAASAAQASNADLLTPLTGNTSDPSNWHFLPGQSFNGVAGALDGVARLSFKNSAGSWACSGSLLAGGQYVLTAAHCADNFTSMKVDFGVVNNVATVSRTVAVGNAYVNPNWTGELDTGADIAILKLDQAVTSIQGYKLSTTNDVGKTFLMAGYGTTSNGSLPGGTNWDDYGFGHYGFNTFDVDSKTFNKDADAAIPGWGYDAAYYAPGVTYMSDFDDGTAAHNTLGRIGAEIGAGWTSGTGLGVKEALISGGDSGGGDFIWSGTEWLLSGVHSWGWQGGACEYFGLSGCDLADSNKSSYGDMSGSTATFSHVGWINSVTAVPEPATYGMMLSGLALVGAVARRRRQVRTPR